MFKLSFRTGTVMPVSSITPAFVASLFPQRTTGFDFSIFGGSGGTGQVFSAGDVGVALKQAEANEARQLAAARKDPVVQRDLARYADVVRNAKTVDDVLNDPVARRVFMTANGLGEQSQYLGLSKRALTSDILDPDSLANKLASTNGAWRSTLETYNLHLFGVGALKTSTAIETVSANYVAEKRLDQLDAQLPGLGSAILFKRIAASLDTTTKVLGSALGREVVTTALGLPRQIAVQSIEAQVKAVETRLDVTKLAEPAFVDRLVQRYLISLNGGTGGLTA
ncbi:DUF1217 domain-containing protein [bacterium]|nr:DUF1217 domain-containing protein [bacterium]